MRMLWIIGVGLLVACTNQTSIQGDYISERDDCQSEAEDRIDDYSEGGEDADLRLRNAKLVSLFSDCMFEHGWTVAAPEREGGENPPELDARRAAAHDTSVGVGDTIKPGQVVTPTAQHAPTNAYPVAPAPQQVPQQPIAPPGHQYQLVPAAPPPPPPGYQYRLVPAPQAAPGQ